jgi:hypothetical protein
MTDVSSYDYLYIVEWDDSVHRPPYTVMHRIKLNPEVSREDFEKFMVEEGFPPVGKVSTRAGAVAAQYLLIDTTGDPPMRLEELDLNLGSFGSRTSVTKFRVVSSWKRAEDI